MGFEMSPKVMSIIEIARRLQAPDLCPVCRQDWRQASCSHQGADLEHLCREEIDALCTNIMPAQALDPLLDALAEKKENQS